jgi:hypothetical protein
MDLKLYLSELFIDNPWMALVVFLIAIVGIILTTIFGLKSLKKKHPMIEMKSDNLIKDFTGKFDGLKIELEGKACENLTATKIVFWNNGRETISDTDIPELAEMSIVPKKDIKIFASKVIKVANKANNFSIINLTDKILIKFEYLDKNEGGVIQILHSGESGEDLIVNGTIKGFGKLENNKIPRYFVWLKSFFDYIDNIVIKFFFKKEEKNLHNIKKRYKRILAAILSFLLPIIMTVELFSPAKCNINTNKFIYGKLFLIFFTFILYYPMGFYLIKRRVPKKLDLL